MFLIASSLKYLATDNHEYPTYTILSPGQLIIVRYLAGNELLSICSAFCVLFFFMIQKHHFVQ